MLILDMNGEKMKNFLPRFLNFKLTHQSTTHENIIERNNNIRLRVEETFLHDDL